MIQMIFSNSSWVIFDVHDTVKAVRKVAIDVTVSFNMYPVVVQLINMLDNKDFK